MVILILTASNATGLKTGTTTQNLFTFAKFAALIGLTALGLLLGKPDAALHMPDFFRAVSPSGDALAGLALLMALGTAMVGPLFSQSAWNNVTFAGEEVKEPGTDAPAGPAPRVPPRDDALRACQRRLPERPLVTRDPAPARRPRRDGRRHEALRSSGGGGDGGRDHGLHFRLRERI